MTKNGIIARLQSIRSQVRHIAVAVSTIEIRIVLLESTSKDKVGESMKAAMLQEKCILDVHFGSRPF